MSHPGSGSSDSGVLVQCGNGFQAFSEVNFCITEDGKFRRPKYIIIYVQFEAAGFNRTCRHFGEFLPNQGDRLNSDP
jgi:hypothetical protein